jgi:hypothetical protein
MAEMPFFQAFSTILIHCASYGACSKGWVQHPGSPGDQARELLLRGRPSRKDSGIHRLFQSNLGQAFQVDVHREAAERVKPSNEGRVGKISGSVEGGFSQSVLAATIDQGDERPAYVDRGRGRRHHAIPATAAVVGDSPFDEFA